MNRFELEYGVKASKKVIFDRLSNASGLQEWFADEVNQRDNIFSFVWDGSEQKAELLSKKDNSHVRFRWLEQDDDEAFFEFRLEVDPITSDLALIVVDFADDDDEDDAVELWDNQINALFSLLGI